MKIFKWLKKDWFKLIIVIAFIIGLLWLGRACSNAKYEKDIAKLDDEILELNEKNVKLAGEVNEYFADALANEKVVADLKAEVVESKLRIEELEKEEAEVGAIVAELPPSQLVEDTRMILECAEIELTEDGVLFSVACAQSNLVKLKRFSLVENKYDEAIFALSKSEEALHFQERVAWNLYGVAWKLGDQILNLKVIGKRKDKKFELSEKQRRKSWWNGLKIGLVIGGGLTITFVIIMPLIRLLI